MNQAESAGFRPTISFTVGACRCRRGLARTFLTAMATAMGTAALAGTSLAIPVAAASPTPSPTNYGSATVTTETLAGADLYGTAIAISQNVSPDGGLPVVYLVSGASGADAAAAGWAAAREGGVVLYTPASSLPAAVADELVRLKPSRVEVMGGASGIADSVLSQVIALLPAATVVERVSGSDAFGTAATLSARSFQANTGATYHAITPGRVLDSRSGVGATRFVSKVKQTFAVAGLFGVPADAVGVTGNVTIVGQTQAGYVTVAPSLAADALPSTSTINFPVGDIRANGITVSLGPGASSMPCTRPRAPPAVSTSSSTSPATSPTTPPGPPTTPSLPGGSSTRALESERRGSCRRSSRSFAVAGLFGVPADAVGVTGNVTIVGQTQAGYVTVAPSLAADATALHIDDQLPGRRHPGQRHHRLPRAGGKLDAMYAAASAASSVDIIFDVTGYFANDPPGATYHAVTPGRVLDWRSGVGATRFVSKVKQTFAVAGPLRRAGGCGGGNRQRHDRGTDPGRLRPPWRRLWPPTALPSTIDDQLPGRRLSPGQRHHRLPRAGGQARCHRTRPRAPPAVSTSSSTSPATSRHTIPPGPDLPRQRDGGRSPLTEPCRGRRRGIGGGDTGRTVSAGRAAIHCPRPPPTELLAGSLRGSPSSWSASRSVGFRHRPDADQRHST